MPKLIQSEECREVQHNVLTEMQIQVNTLEHATDTNHDKMIEKIDKILDRQNEIIVANTKQNGKIVIFGNSLAQHMKDEEKTIGIVFWGLGIFGTLLTGVLGYVAVEVSSLGVSVASIETSIPAIQEDITSMKNHDIKEVDRINDLEILIYKNAN